MSQTASDNCFVSHRVSPQTARHCVAMPEVAQVLETSISRAEWGQALTPTVTTEISWSLLRSRLLLLVLDTAWYRCAQHHYSHIKQLCMKICV